MKMTDQEIVDSVNKMYPPESKGYDVAFIVDGNPMVTSESFTSDPITLVVDYQEMGMDWCDSCLYDEFGIYKEFAEWLEKNGLSCEWAHGGGVKIYYDNN